MIERGKESGAEGRYPFEQEGQGENPKTIHRDLKKRLISVSKYGSQRSCQKFD